MKIVESFDKKLFSRRIFIFLDVREMQKATKVYETIFNTTISSSFGAA